MNQKNQKMLQSLYMEEQKIKVPNLWERHIEMIRINPKLGGCIIAPKFADNSANSLTKSVVAYINFIGGLAQRISVTGRTIKSKGSVDYYSGQNRSESKYIPSTMMKGAADIRAIYKGNSIDIEIKFGKDRQSEAQKDYQTKLTLAGGHYWIVKDFDSFIIMWNEFINNRQQS